MNWLPISYPKLSGTAVDTINSLLACAQPLELADGNVTCTVRPPAAGERRTRCISLCVEAGGVPMGVHLSPATLDAILVDLLPRQAFEALDDDLQITVLEVALAEPLKTLTRFLQAPVSLTGIASNGELSGPADVRHVSPHSLRFEIRRKSDESLFGVQVDIDAGLPAAACTALREAAVHCRRDLSHLPAPVVFEYGTASLSMSEMSSLEPGDIVLFDECYIDGGQLRINISDRTFLRGAVKGLELTVAAPGKSEAVSL